ncbi:MAG: TatD family hydrolase [Anaerolineae bacterium]|nr:TatD family hydrolase [Anaerolineae bacterium]
MELFDSHVHLESSRFDSDRLEVIARARSAGVTAMITCGTDLETSAQEIVLARGFSGVYAAVGVHAHEARSIVIETEKGWRLSEEALQRLWILAQQPGVVAIGEIGLDYHYNFSPPEIQKLVLAQQLKLASELDLPVILHNREADEDMRSILDNAPSELRGVLHCFLADQEMAEWALGRGFYLGVGGPVTFRKMEPLRRLIRQLPLERLLIETDSPYLAPRPKRGQRNEPAYVRYVAERLAELFALPLTEIAARTYSNASQLFGLE